MQSILKRLGYKEGEAALVLNAPQVPGEALRGAMNPKPDEQAAGVYPFILAFVKDMAGFEGHKALLAELIAPQGRLWVCYPKKSSKMYKSDVSRDALWPGMGEMGFEPVSQYALDEDWSAMRFRPVHEIKKMVRQNAATKEGRQRVEEAKKTEG